MNSDTDDFYAYSFVALVLVFGSLARAFLVALPTNNSGISSSIERSTYGQHCGTTSDRIHIIFVIFSVN